MKEVEERRGRSATGERERERARRGDGERRREDRAHVGMERSLLSLCNHSPSVLPCHQVGRLLDTLLITESRLEKRKKKG